MAHLRPDTPLKFLKGVGERRAEAFARIGITNAQELLWHIPFRYLDASMVTPMQKARVGDEVACVGTVIAKRLMPTRSGLRIFTAVLRDASGMLECAWPGQGFLDRTIEVGQVLLVMGTVRFYHGRQLSPREFVILSEAGTDAEPQPIGKVLPVYSATEGLSHKVIRGLVDRHLDEMIAFSRDPLPEAIPESLHLPPLPDALRLVHRPPSIEEAELGRRRLAFDELLDLQLMLARARLLARRKRVSPPFTVKQTFTTGLLKSLPWELTADQKRVLREITGDMTSPTRMHRLLMGDVGTGKTVVALFAMLLALENDAQAALMAPTELLAEQHYATLTKLLEPLDIRPELLIGRLTPTEKGLRRKQLASGRARLVVGTHALLEDTVSFQKLGLVVIDEQHRFGVDQRARLIAKGDAADVLLLSATPIPRSLALTRFGDLDISILKQRPPGRGKIHTGVRTDSQREKAFEFVYEQCINGRQAYIVLPIIDESEKIDLRAATTAYERLKKQWPELSVALVHGRLKPDERDPIMRRFRAGQVQVLVATTVIEVGIDVPNATVMVIEQPERFGLAQLHQLRGRIGRGANESYCILMAGEKIPPRLKAFAATDDGFKIAELDLQERQMGDLIGERQAGSFELRLAKLPDDQELLEKTREVASKVLEEDPMLIRPRHQGLKERALGRYPRAIELFRNG